MSANSVVVQGTVLSDGTLILDKPLNLPICRVQVTVQPLAEDAPGQDPFWVMMVGIWAAQKARGHIPRTREEIDAEIDAMREEAEEEFQEVERLHEEGRRAREQSQEQAE